MGRSYVDDRYLKNYLVVKIGLGCVPLMINDIGFYDLSHVGCQNH